MKNNHTILIVDDNPQNIDILVELLSDYELLVSLSAINALELIEENQIDLILLDVMMPDMDGLEMASILKNNKKFEAIPILFISAKQDDKSIERGFKIGAQDYIAKPFKPLELRARIKTHLKLYDLIQELDYSANYDFLSGAKNRRSFFIEADDYFYKPINNLFAIMLDIDRFKYINDTYGHAIGDEVIKNLSTNVKEELYKDMLFARIGGEEFAILVKHLPYDTIFTWVESLREKINKQEMNIDGVIINYSISCGISKYDNSMKNIDYLLNEADIALYEAKNSGRNKTIFRIKE